MDSLMDALTMIYLGENLANGKIQNTLLVGSTRIPTVKLKISGKAFLKSESRTSVTFKL